MKRMLLAGAVVVLMVGSLAAAPRREGPVSVQTKYKNLFVFKADRKFFGAKVEVVHANGDVIAMQTLQKRKMIIDFCDVKHGSYTIRITKGDDVKEFHYDKM